MDRNRQMAERIAEKVAQAGGRCYYVGGLVRDEALGRKNKDVDIEVHGITADRLEEILNSLGKCIPMGASFGIYGMKGHDIDIALPRRGDAVSRSYKDMADTADPFIGEENAARRRDFTMNALMRDVLSGEILDFFGGERDMAAGVLRHVDAGTFSEDPLRVLRAAQFAARFGFEIAPETRTLCAGLPLEGISRERVLAETEKALLKADRPSIFWDELRKMGQLDPWFSEVENLSTEEKIWKDVLKRLDTAAAFRGEAAQPMPFMLSALGLSLDANQFETLLQRLTNEAALLKYAANTSSLADTPNRLAAARAEKADYMKLFDRAVNAEDLLLLNRVLRVCAGDDDIQTEKLLRDRLSEYRTLMQTPAVTGTDLIALGIPSGVKMGMLLTYTHELHLKGVSKEDALSAALAYSKTI